MSSKWKPLLRRAERQNGIILARDISDCITRGLEQAPVAGRVGARIKVRDPSLSSGLALYALVYAYSYLVSNNSADLERCNRVLMAAAEALASQRLSPFLYQGVAGVGWAIQHIIKRLGRERIAEGDALVALLGQIDDFLCALVRRDSIVANYDLISGLTGLGVYFLERLPQDTATTALEELVGVFAERSERVSEGVCWFTSPSVVPAGQRVRYPSGYYDLGVAHGIAGVIGLLSRIAESGIMQSTARELVRESATWLLHQRLSRDSMSCFATVLDPGGRPPSPSRLAWCYGDAGESLCLLSAARCLHDPNLWDAALGVARIAASRTIENAGVNDASLCHGAFGLAHAFSRWYQCTRLRAFRDRARYWFATGMGMRANDGWSCGYRFWGAGPGGTIALESSLDLLTGVAGIALVSLAAASDVAPNWDAVLLMDAQPCIVAL